MKLVDLSSAYQIQKKYTQKNKVIAYKVGASNYRSSEFFGCEDILLGALDRDCVYYNKILKDYPLAEVEVVSKILISDSGKEYEVLEHFLGIECPEIVVDNPDGSPFICVADNCSAGDLIIFQKLDDIEFEIISVYADGDLLISGAMDNLKFAIDDIIERTFDLIKIHDLPLSSREMLIATGGITDVFPLEAGMKVEINCE